jgi:hypothetical protein
MLPLLLSAALVTAPAASPLEWRLSDAVPTEVVQATGPDPRIAVALSTATPVAILAGLYATNMAVGSQYLLVPMEINRTVIVGFPIGFGAGYVYAGEPTRGLLVGLGGTAITGLGFGYLSMFSGQDGMNRFPFVAASMLAALVGYGWWVAQDVHRVAEEKRNPPATK